jgi:MFS family permease
VNVLLNIFSAVGTNFFGRKTLLLQGTLLCFGFLTGLSVLSAINTNNQGTSSSIQSLLIAFVFLYLSAFGLSLGPLTWVYNAEILTGKGVTITTLANWFGTIVISFTFPVLVDHIDMWIIFVFFAVSCLLGAIFIYFYVVETKGLTSKEIEAAF